jgi:hypothetical protein
MTEAAEATMVSVALAGLRQFEEWQDFAPEALNLATAYPSDFGLRDQVAGIAKRFGRQGAVLRFWEEAARPKFKVVAKPQVYVEPKFKRRKLTSDKSEKPKGGAEQLDGAIAQSAQEAAAALIAAHTKSEGKSEGKAEAKPEEDLFISPKPQPSVEEEAEPEPKPANALTVIPQSPMAMVPADETPEEKAVREMNDKHAVISNLGGKCVVMEWVPSAISEGQKELSYQSFQAFRERYANQHVVVPSRGGRWETAAFAPLWLAHPHRRQYEGLDLVLGGPPVLPNGYLNLWKDWGVEPRKGSWRLMQRHIAEVLANGNQSFEDYIKRWTAWKFQNPGVRPEVLLALLGGKGVGKGAWGYIQMLIYGPHGLQIFSTEHLTGKHNQHLQNKLFLFLDEALWGGDREAEKVLKGLTTEKAMLIEPKNINAFPWPNRLALYMSGNDKWIVPASHDERRYAVNKVSERRKQNKTYFGPLFDEINNGGAGAMLYDMLQFDLEGWHPRENVPQTKALLDQKMLGLAGLELWYVHLLSVGELAGASEKNPRYVISERLLENAKNHNARNKYTTAEELAGFLKEMGCTHKSNGKKWGWVFPPLADAREAWQRRAGGDWEWLTPGIADWAEKPESEIEAQAQALEGEGGG